MSTTDEQIAAMVDLMNQQLPLPDECMLYVNPYAGGYLLTLRFPGIESLPDCNVPVSSALCVSQDSVLGIIYGVFYMAKVLIDGLDEKPVVLH